MSELKDEGGRLIFRLVRHFLVSICLLVHLRQEGVCADERHGRILQLAARVPGSPARRYLTQQPGHTSQVVILGYGRQGTANRGDRGCRWSVELSLRSSELIVDLLSSWGDADVMVRYSLLDILAQLSEELTVGECIRNGPLWERMWYFRHVM
jgi:hypothetical protein